MIGGSTVAEPTARRAKVTAHIRPCGDGWEVDGVIATVTFAGRPDCEDLFYLGRATPSGRVYGGVAKVSGAYRGTTFVVEIIEDMFVPIPGRWASTMGDYRGIFPASPTVAAFRCAICSRRAPAS